MSTPRNLTHVPQSPSTDEARMAMWDDIAEGWISHEERLEQGLPLHVRKLECEETIWGVCDFCEQDDLDAPPHTCTLWRSTTPGRWVCAEHKGEEEASSSHEDEGGED